MVDVILIDDLPEAYRLAAKLQDDVDHYLTFDLKYSQTIVGNQGLPITGAKNTIKYQELSSFLSSEQISEDLVLILDLGLNLPEIRQQLKEKYPQLKTVPDVQVEGLGLALDANYNPNIKCLMIYFSTSQGNNNDAFDLLEQEIKKLNKQNKSFRALELYHKTGTAFVNTNESTEETREKKARKFLQDLIVKWVDFRREARQKEREIRQKQETEERKVEKNSKYVQIPNLFVGIGLPHDMKTDGFKKYTRLYDYLRLLKSRAGREEEIYQKEIKKFISDLLTSAVEKTILVETPETKKIVDLNLKFHSNSHFFTILKHWAVQAELKKNLVFCEQDFEPKRKTFQENSLSNEDLVKAAKAFSYGKDVRVGKMPSPHNGALKTAICHIRRKLTAALKDNGFVLGTQKIINDGENGKYCPAFESGVYIYFLRSKKG